MALPPQAAGASINAPFKPPSTNPYASTSYAPDSSSHSRGVQTRLPLSPRKPAKNIDQYAPPAQITKSSGTSLQRHDSSLLRTLSTAEVTTSKPIFGGDADIIFDENDIDDDLDFSMDPVAPQSYSSAAAVSKPPNTPIRIPDDPDEPVSWPPSSDHKRPRLSQPSPLGSKGSMPGKPHQTGVMTTSMPSSSPVPAVPKKRILPWEKPAVNPVRYGPQLSKTSAAARSFGTAVASKPLPVTEASIVTEPEQTTPQISRAGGLLDDPTASAMKNLVKDQQRKKRAASEALDEIKQQHEQQLAQTAVVKTRRKEVPKTHLSVEQKTVLRMIVEKGQSVFYTGSAGTGKSVLLREVIHELRIKYRAAPEKVAVTASTGLAACNIGGITLHSFAGVGLGKDDANTLVKKIKRNKKQVTRWLKTSVLIVDEISMVDADFFDKLEAVARLIRKNDKPWGGIQLVVTGDFFQLPPVPETGKPAKFAFEAAKWESIHHTVALTSVFRQKDPLFVNMLNEMRQGKLSKESILAFKKLERPLDFNDGLEATELFPTRQEVECANNARMRSLQGKSYKFAAEDSGALESMARDKILANCMAPPVLELKKGAQVMLIKNMDEQLVNGSLGVVAGFMDEKTFTFIEESGGNEELARICDLGGNLKDCPWPEDMLDAAEGESGQRKKLSAILQQQHRATAKCWPVVCFKFAGEGKQDVYRMMLPESWKTETPTGEVQACRRQVPLILAYAISIHKAQGQTIERVRVDLGKVFEKGQAYVALSRAVSQEGLQVTRFDPRKVMAHEKVTRFYASLSAAIAVDGAGGSLAAQLQAQDEKRRRATERELKNRQLGLQAGSGLDGLQSTQEVWAQARNNPPKAFFGATKFEKRHL